MMQRSWLRGSGSWRARWTRYVAGVVRKIGTPIAADDNDIDDGVVSGDGQDGVVVDVHWDLL